MPRHTSHQFENELQQLKTYILEMGQYTEHALKQGMQALFEHKPELAQKVIDQDRRINTLELKCDELTRRILVLRQPAASDLRFIITSIKVVTDLERMGDLAAGICRRVLKLDHDASLHGYEELEIMAGKVQRQVGRALEAMQTGNPELANTVIQKDDPVDELYRVNHRSLMKYMRRNPDEMRNYIILSDITRNLERIGDHASNISMMAIFMISGIDVRHLTPSERNKHMDRM